MTVNFTIGNTKITINDAATVKSREEVSEILKRCGKIVKDFQKSEVKR